MYAWVIITRPIPDITSITAKDHIRICGRRVRACGLKMNRWLHFRVLQGDLPCNQS